MYVMDFFVQYFSKLKLDTWADLRTVLTNSNGANTTLQGASCLYLV